MDRKQLKTNSVTQKDIVTAGVEVLQVAVYRTDTNDSVVIEPSDPEKPFEINGKQYKNVKITRQRSIKIDSSKINQKKETKKTDQSKVHTAYEFDEKRVKVARDSSFGFWDWLWLLLAIAAVFILVYKRKSIYKKVVSLFTKNTV